MPSTVRPLRKIQTANSTSAAFTAFTSIIPTTTKPSGTGVFDLLSETVSENVGRRIPAYIQIQPFGVGTDTTTFVIRVIGWSRTIDSTPTTEVWVPTHLADLTCTLSVPTANALTNGVSNVFCDTIAETKGGDDVYSISPAIDTPASVKLGLRGSELIQFDFDMTGATSGNALWRLLDE